MSGSKSFETSEIHRLVERQMRNWELDRAVRRARPEAQRAEIEPFVAISRQVGAGGREVAMLLGERLGWAVFDKEILHAMAGDDATRERVYASMDERDLGWFAEMMRSLLDRSFVRNDYFHRLTKTVFSIARNGRAVFLGRGIGWLLPRTAGLRVRIVAPLEIRLRSYCAQNKMAADEACATMERLEQERAQFINAHFGADVADPSEYDLTVNLGRFSTVQAVDLIETANKLRHADKPA